MNCEQVIPLLKPTTIASCHQLIALASPTMSRLVDKFLLPTVAGTIASTIGGVLVAALVTGNVSMRVDFGPKVINSPGTTEYTYASPGTTDYRTLGSYPTSIDYTFTPDKGKTNKPRYGYSDIAPNRPAGARN